MLVVGFFAINEKICGPCSAPQSRSTGHVGNTFISPGTYQFHGLSLVPSTACPYLSIAYQAGLSRLSSLPSFSAYISMVSMACILRYLSRLTNFSTRMQMATFCTALLAIVTCWLLYWPRTIFVWGHNYPMIAHCAAFKPTIGMLFLGTKKHMVTSTCSAKKTNSKSPLALIYKF